LLNTEAKFTDGEEDSGKKGNYKKLFRGVGDLKLLKNKSSNKIRLLVRAEKTHKIVANHLLQAEGTL
jgi:hypothetical protein